MSDRDILGVLRLALTPASPGARAALRMTSPGWFRVKEMNVVVCRNQIDPLPTLFCP